MENLTINMIFGIVYFHEIILESLRNVSETTSETNFFGTWSHEYSYTNHQHITYLCRISNTNTCARDTCCMLKQHVYIH